MRITIANNSSVLNDIFKACLLVLGSALLASCVTNNSDTADDIYFNSQEEADNRLAAFDEENPSCQLWTNWQKMCSRTGPNEETFCVADPGKSVRPSEPFCGIRLIEKPDEPILKVADIPETITESEKSGQSRNRFCAEFWDGNPENIGLEENISLLHKKKALCLQHKTDRPFNGLSAKSQENPRCKEWKKNRAGLYYCSAPLTDENCTYVTNGVQPPVVSEGGVYASRAFFSEQVAFWGLYCNRWVRR